MCHIFSRTLITVGAAVVVFTSAVPAMAQPRPGPPVWIFSGINNGGGVSAWNYYNISPASGFLNPVQFAWIDFEHAWASEPPNPASYQVSPASPGGQPPGFSNYGYDRKSTGAPPPPPVIYAWPTDVWNSPNVGGANVVTVYQNVAWPFTPPGSSTVSAVSGGCSATATASATVNSSTWPISVYGAPMISGGTTTGGTGSAYKYASSTVQLYAGGWQPGPTTRPFQMNWVWRWWLGGVSNVSGAGASSDAGGQDEPEYDTGAFRPGIKYGAVAKIPLPDGTVLQEKLAESSGTIDWTSNGAEATMEWNEGQFIVSEVEYGRFYVDLTNECIDAADRGMVDLRINHGVVTTSRATGIFAGMLPPVGIPANFAIPLPEEGTFNFELPALENEEAEYEFDLCASEPDQPAVWTGDGPDSNWSAPENWLYAAPPNSDVSLYFSAKLPTGQAVSFNDFLPGTQFNAIVFRPETDVAYTLEGNSITLDGLVENSSPEPQTINLNMVLPAEGATFETIPGDLVVGGKISGLGGLTKNGLGIVSLLGNNEYQGPTTINEGTLELIDFGQIAASSGVENNAIFRISGGDHTVSTITGDGETEVFLGTLTTSSISQGMLTIGGGAKLTIAPQTGMMASSPVPEPNTLVLLAMVGLGVLLAARRQK